MAIAEAVPRGRIIYLVRDPIERIPAMVRQGVSVGFIRVADIESGIAVADHIGDLENEENPFIASGRYMTQVDQYLEHFSPDAILIVDSDELRGARAETMANIFEFLGCDPAAVTQGFDQIENSGDDLMLRPAAYAWLKRRSSLRRLYRRQPDNLRDALGGRIARLTGKPIPRPVIDDRLRSELEEIFRPEVERLRDFTGQKFEGWSV